MDFHSVDIQFGNHDILWLGAAAGSKVCIANVIRVSARYGNLDILEDGYGINLMPLAQLANEYYINDPCEVFLPKTEGEFLKERDISIISKMHKAISIIQFKLEGQLVEKNPEYKMSCRRLLNKIDFQNGVFKFGKKNIK
jgi:fructose-1,6-bisphosphatase-3